MELDAVLAPEHVAALSDPERACEEASRTLVVHEGGEFEESLRVKNTLDLFEERAKSEPGWNVFSVLVNCEYRLYMLNQGTPLRNNPFLSHWVEAIQRAEGTSVARATNADIDMSSENAFALRVEFVKTLLDSRDPSRFACMSPRQLYTYLSEQQQTHAFNLGPYVRMLEEEGIYEHTPSPPDTPQPTKVAPASKQTNTLQHWRQALRAQLDTDPAAAIPQLTHLPLELASLDFLTTLLQDGTLPSLGIDPAPIISDYLQHALRLIEAMGRPPDGTSSLTALDNDNAMETNGVAATATATATATAHGEMGREAQARAVKLLLLFMRNLIRKGFVPVEAIYFEIQEVCVRFVWIREVREFRAFVEEGEGEGV